MEKDIFTTIEKLQLAVSGLGDIECRLVPWAEAEETFKDNGHALKWCFEQIK